MHGDVTGHLHGHCPSTDGGIKQTIAGLVSGATYTLEYTAWSGSWDGHDSDRLDTSIANSQWTVHPNSNQEIQDGRGAGLKVAHTFKATSASAVLKFYSPRHNCIDIDDVSIEVKKMPHTHCSTWTECDKEAEWEYQTPTRTSDRVCNKLTTCNFNSQWESKVPDNQQRQ